MLIHITPKSLRNYLSHEITLCISPRIFSLYCVVHSILKLSNCVHKFYLYLNTLEFIHCYKFSWSYINKMPYITIKGMKKNLTTLKKILVLARSKLSPSKSLKNHTTDQFIHFLSSFDFFRVFHLTLPIPVSFIFQLMSMDYFLITE